ncbi:hypothetical protein [Marinobacter sp. P4B1]|uniref:hypothetical protein n=1 Tax=Marinobacter sp. P4B1 TaxID=1119533 RepID=UPI00156BAA9A|nr:hypothetical protein [Marinobacter sp. P4B1]
MKALKSTNITLTIKITGFRFLKVRPYQLTVRGRQDTRGALYPQGNSPRGAGLPAN